MISLVRGQQFSGVAHERVGDPRHLAQRPLQEFGHPFRVGQDVEGLERDEQLSEHFCGGVGGWRLFTHECLLLFRATIPRLTHDSTTGGAGSILRRAQDRPPE